ncbi:ribosome maturation factor RimM [Nocardioides gilvus]|uniref:ribosome maturation factor RimM n=1 Tax=Nocardioides gilvus TaxID=1735589 RepID=UPI0019511EF2|nr:ribosome maturation factor RimM [Nocardioides gilvus]
MKNIDVLVGRIGKPHGLRGEVTIDVRTDEPELRFAAGSTLTAVAPKGSAAQWRTLTVRSSRWHQGTLLLAFEELPGRNEAEAARGIMLHVELAPDSAPSAPDEFYEHQLRDLTVRDLDGREIGTVVGLVPGAAQDLLSIRSADGRDTLVPFVEALVPEVDVTAGFLVVADRPGLVSPFPDDDVESAPPEA